MNKQLPLVVVFGATACGKSKLAIELARRFRGEIISADSMQVYHGLDIVTNKVSEEEQQQAKHHMINFLDPMQRYSVVDFRNKSLSIIEDLQKKNSLPIVVGGTNYYIESLLWRSFLLGTLPASKQVKRPLEDHDTLETESQEGTQESGTLIDSEAKLLNKLPKDFLHSEEDFLDVDKFFEKPIYNDAFTEVPGEKLWNILEKVDSVSAHLYHPNDKRRIIRCLQIIQEKGRNYSDLLKDLNKSSEESRVSLGGPLRFETTCVLWLDCEKKILDKVLDERIDQMLDRGLLAELENFHEEYNKQRVQRGEKPDYEKGIYQTIGFKEFHDYLMLDSTIRESEEGNEILKKCIVEMKISTRRYARKQLSWIKRRFLQTGTRDLPPVFKLTTSFDEKEWAKQVREPAFEIIESLIEKRPLKDELLCSKQSTEEQSVKNNPGKFYCKACDRTFIGSHYIESHLRSRTHDRRVKKLKKQRPDDKSDYAESKQ